MKHIQSTIAFAALLAALPLLPGRALGVATHGDAPPPLDSILPDRPKPLTNILNGLPQPPDPHQASPGRDPLGAITSDMGHVVTDLDHQDTGQFVQGEQDQIVRNLDMLIKELEKQSKSSRKSGGTSASMNPTKPMTDSRLAGGPGGIHDLHSPRAGQRSWGDLPPKERQQIMQSRTEGFPAGYENILQSYYFRLSQEQVVRDGAAAPTPAPAVPVAQP